MLQAHSHFIPFDLLSNFLTRTYLDTLETLYYHGDYHLDSSEASLNTIKSLKSFLFIFQSNPKNITILQQQIFDFFTPYACLTKDEIIKQELELYPTLAKTFYMHRRSLNLSALKKTYAKNLLWIKKESSYEPWQNYNAAFIHMHRNLVYHRFKEESSLPRILTASTASDFILYIWEYYLDYLVTVHNFTYLSETIDMLHQSSLPHANQLIAYLKDKLILLEYSTEADSLLKKLF